MQALLSSMGLDLTGFGQGLPALSTQNNDRHVSQAFPIRGLRLGPFLLGGPMIHSGFPGNIDWFAISDHPRGSAPANPRFVESLVSRKISDPKDPLLQENADGSGKPCCAVCLAPFAVGTTVMKMPCSHAFCEPCLSPWLRLHSTCPTCRCEVPSVWDQDEKVHMEPCSHSFMLSQFRDATGIDGTLSCPVCKQDGVLVYDDQEAPAPSMDPPPSAASVAEEPANLQNRRSGRDQNRSTENYPSYIS